MTAIVSGYVSGPNERGTLDIVWTCVVTLFLSLWASWHEDIPQTPTPLMRRYSKKLKWMLILLIFPECGLLVSLGQRFQARKIARTLRSMGFTEWTQTHCMFALMGGIRIENNSCDAYRTYGDHHVHSKVALNRCWCNSLRIRATDLPRLAELNLLPATPPVSAAEIDDSGKADVLVKMIALVQLLWLLIQCIGRAVQRLAISELEIISLAYVFYCLLIYAGWWQKPLDATLLSTVYIEHTPDFDTYFKNKAEETDVTTEARDALPNIVDICVQGNSLVSESVLTLMSVILFGTFGAIHCAAWNNYFPTHIELWFWRASSLMLMCFMPLMWVCEMFADQIASDVDRQQGVVSVFTNGDCYFSLIVCTYIVARLYVIVESFVVLRKQPASVYQTVEWSNFIPHIN